MPCGEIIAGVTYDCENPLQGGANARIWVLNHGDVTAVVEDGTLDNLLTDITLAASKTAFKFEGFRNSVSGVQELIVPDSGQSLFKHQTGLTIFGITQVIKNQVQNLALGRFIVIVENNGKNANSFEVYGLNQGLVLTSGQVKSTGENNGAYTLVLASDEVANEAKLPQTLFDTDYATTLALIIALES